MRRIALSVALIVGCLIGSTLNGYAVNHVRVDTMSNVAPGTTGLVIGIYLTNDIPITGFVIPLEIRTWSGGAYMVTGGFTRGLNTPGRANNSPLGAAYDNGNDSIWPGAFVTNSTYPATEANTTTSWCDRSFFQSSVPNLKWKSSAAQPDFISPDAILLTSVSGGSVDAGELISMGPGTDPQGTPSLRIVCNVGNTQGMFIIDTTCSTPANHLSFVNEATQEVVPTFQHGIVGIGVIADVKEIETGVVPDEYHLEQNYPNPFNAGTIIRFTNKIEGNVEIEVFNILGARVRTLVDEFLPAGVHQVDWDGTNQQGDQLATGVYFYRINAGQFQSTRKMVLLK